MAPPTCPSELTQPVCALRHLVFCILDLLLELLVPEVSDQDFQSHLLQKLSRSPEKMIM